MPDADINLHPDLIELVDGDVSISQVLTVLGKLLARAGLEVFTAAGQLALDISESTGNAEFKEALSVLGNAQFNGTLSVFSKLFARAGLEVRTSSNEQAFDVDETTGVAEFTKTVNANGTVNIGSSGDSGLVVVKDSNNNTRFQFYGSSATVYLRRSDGSIAAKINTAGIELYDSSGNRTIDLSTSGTHNIYEDLEFQGSADIKLEGLPLTYRLSEIEGRLDTLEGYH